LPPLEERTEYPYQNIRSKNFQWGDGDKVSLNSELYIENRTDLSVVALVSLAFACPASQ
jgi:cytochrome c oxidase subunit 6a